jgi:hypothetical protein
LEHSESEPHNSDDHNSQSLQQRKVLDGQRKVLDGHETREEFNKDANEVKKPTDILSCNSTDDV